MSLKKWGLHIFALVLLGVIGCKFEDATGPLKVDGSSPMRMYTSIVQMLETAKNDADKVRKLRNGFAAANLIANHALPFDIENAKKLSDEEYTRLSKSFTAKRERIEGEILDGMTAEEVIKFGEENYEEVSEKDTRRWDAIRRSLSQ